MFLANGGCNDFSGWTAFDSNYTGNVGWDATTHIVCRLQHFHLKTDKSRRPTPQKWIITQRSAVSVIRIARRSVGTTWKVSFLWIAWLVSFWRVPICLPHMYVHICYNQNNTPNSHTHTLTCGYNTNFQCKLWMDCYYLWLFRKQVNPTIQCQFWAWIRCHISTSVKVFSIHERRLQVYVCVHVFKKEAYIVVSFCFHFGVIIPPSSMWKLRRHIRNLPAQQFIQQPNQPTIHPSQL